MMRALEPFEVTVTFCFTPEERGLAPHHTSPPLVDEEFAEFCARMLRRYWRAGGSADAPLGCRRRRMNGAARRRKAFLARLAGRGAVAERVMIVVAHPDDETIGIGAQLGRFDDALLVHVTDGAPRDGDDARNYGFASVADYAAARQSRAGRGVGCRRRRAAPQARSRHPRQGGRGRTLPVWRGASPTAAASGKTRCRIHARL